jgi:hypothetical protein
MRLLSFLSDIEQALLAESPVVEGGAWETSRMMSFHHGLARLTLNARGSSDLPCAGGTIFLQTFALADGSLCLKASLGWKDSEVSPVLSVYSNPIINWTTEASRIASAWLKGPPAQTTTAPTEQFAPLAAATG